MTTADLYEGDVFRHLDEGRRKRDALGIAELGRRARRASAQISGPVVFGGFSMGTAVAELLGLSEHNAVAVVLMHGALPVQAFERERWPARVAVQVHYSADDALVSHRDVGELRLQVEMSGATFEQHVYPGGGHLFAEPELDDFNPELAELMLSRVSAFVGRLGGR